MKFLMLRWKIVSLYWLDAANARKFSHVLGVEERKSSSFMGPSVVCNVRDIVRKGKGGEGRL